MIKKFILFTIIQFLFFSYSAQTLTSSPFKDSQKESTFLVSSISGSGVFSVLYKSETRGPMTLYVSDATGKYVFLKAIKGFTGEFKETIDISSNPKGIFIFGVEGDNQGSVKKVVYQ